MNSRGQPSMPLPPLCLAEGDAKRLDELQARYDQHMRREFYLQGLFDEARTLRIHVGKQLCALLVQIWPDVPCERCGAAWRMHGSTDVVAPTVQLHAGCASFVLDNMTPIVEILRGKTNRPQSGGGAAAAMDGGNVDADVYLSANIRPNYQPVRAPPLLHRVNKHTK